MSILSQRMVILVVSCVYGSPNFNEREELWDLIISRSSSINLPWLLLGDFSAYLSVEDKSGGGLPNLRAMARFQNCLDCCQLMDIGFHGPRFTWEGRDIRERLDRGICNVEWRTKFFEAAIFHLPCLKSDHRPLLLSTKPNQEISRVQRPFRFMAN